MVSRDFRRVRPSLAAAIFVACFPGLCAAQGIGPTVPPPSRPAFQKQADDKMTADIAKAAKVFNEALNHQKAGRNAEAIAGYKEVIRLAPHAYPAHINLGLIYRSQGRLTEAEQSLKRAAGLDPKNPLPPEQLSLIYLAEGKFADAKVQATKATGLDPKSAEAHFALGAANAGLKQIEAAERSYREACRLSPKKAQYFVAWATTLGALNRLAEAQAALDSALKADPNSYQANMYRGILYQTSKDYKSAVEAYKRAAEIEPREAAPLYNMGISLQLQAKPNATPMGDPAIQEAISAYLKVIELKPDFQPAHLNIARLYFRLGNYRQAARYFDQTYALSKGNVKLLADTAAANFYAGQMTTDQKEKAAYRQKAESLYREGLAKSADSALFSGLGALYEQSSQVDRAAEIYQEWTQKQPKVADAWIALGKARDLQKRPTEAQAAYEKAVALGARNSAARMALAGMLENQNKLDLAIAQYQQVIAQEPKNKDARRHLGQIYVRQNRHPEAIAQFEEMKKIAPKETAAYIAIASVYEKEKKLEEATREYRAMAAADPKSAVAHWYIARGLEAQKKYEEAANEYREIGKIDPKDMFYVSNIPRLMELAGKPEEALDEYKRLVGREPKNVQFHTMYGMALEKAHRHSEAIREYEAILDQSTNATWVHMKIGDAYAALKKWPDARVSYSRALEKPAEAVEAFGKIEKSFTEEGNAAGWYPFLQNWLAKHPKDRIALAKIEPAAVSANKLPELIEFLKGVAVQNAKDSYFQLDYASFLSRHGKKEDAMAAYRTAAALRPEDFGTRLTLAALYEQAGRTPDAIAMFEEITNIRTIAPTQMAVFRVKLAGLYEKNGQTQLALGQYRLAVQADPNNMVASAAVKRLGG